MSSKAKILRMSKLILGLWAASWRLPALLKTMLSSTRWPRLAQTPAAVCAPLAVALNTSQNTLWNGGVGEIKLMSNALALFPTSRIRLPSGALVYARGRVAPKPRLPSTRKRDSVLPSTRRGGVLKIDTMSCILGLVLRPLGLSKKAPKMPQHDPLKALLKQNPCIFTVFALWSRLLRSRILHIYGVCALVAVAWGRC